MGTQYLFSSQYVLTIIDVRNIGRQTDGGVLSNSFFGQALESNKLHLQPPKAFPGVATIDLFVFIPVSFASRAILTQHYVKYSDIFIPLPSTIAIPVVAQIRPAGRSAASDPWFNNSCLTIRGIVELTYFLTQGNAIGLCNRRPCR